MDRIVAHMPVLCLHCTIHDRDMNPTQYQGNLAAFAVRGVLSALLRPARYVVDTDPDLRPPLDLRLRNVWKQNLSSFSIRAS